MNFDQAIKYLKSFVSYEDIVEYKYNEDFFDLRRYERFLKAYGLRYRDLKCVHVAGSKGKGTTSSLVAGYLGAAGKKVGLFTSPYIVDATESFVVGSGGKMRQISKKDFVGRVEKVREFLDEWVDQDKGRYVTYFEILFALVMEYFLEVGVDFAVIEVGLGGRLDATNVVRPVVTCLTTVEKEHTEVLGETYREILGEKLGIVKAYNEQKQVPLVIAPQRARVLSELVGRKFEVPVCYVEGDVGDNYAVVREILMVMVDRDEIDEFDEELFGKVYEKLEVLGRFQVRDGVVFDIAHTVESAKVLNAKLKSEFSGREFVFLISMMKGKDVSGFLKKLFSGLEVGKVVFTSSHDIRGRMGAELAKIYGGGRGVEVVVEEDFGKAFVRAKKGLKKDQVLVVTGSHFLVGKILKTL
ncbi:hypothetical protein HOF67_00525 [Candidatus Peregrinibacteria bacterium]|nr:hypothetical protein [Candidatus Peregrinibacteria bacterium]